MNTSKNLSPDQTLQGWNAVVEKYEAAGDPLRPSLPKKRYASLTSTPDSMSLMWRQVLVLWPLRLQDLGRRSSALTFSPAMVSRLRTRLTEENLTNASVEEMDGQAMAFEDDSFDMAFSVFGVIFFPDYAKGLREMWRVLKPAGRAAVVAWSAPERLEFLQVIMGALRTAVPSFPPPPRPPVWVCLSEPDVFESEMTKAGFRQVSIHTVKHVWGAPSAEWFWQYLPGLSPGLSFVFDKLSPEEIEAFGKVFINQFKSGPVAIEGEAHVGIGVK